MGRMHATGIERLYILIGVPWLFLMIFTSRMYTEIKMVLLGVLFTIAALEVASKNLRMNQRHKSFVIIFVIYSFMSLLWGIILGYQFEFVRDFSLIQYYMITPICVLVFSTVLGYKESRLTYLWNLLKYLTLALVILDVAKVTFALLGQDPPFLSFIMLTGENYTTKLSIRVSNEPSLMLLVPMYIYLFFNSDTRTKNDKFIYGLIMFFGIIYAVMSGRKMLEVVVFASIIISMMYKNGKISTKQLLSFRIMVFVIIGTPILLFLLSLVFDKFSAIAGIENIYQLAYDTITKGFSTDVDAGGDGTVKRIGNTGALLNMWITSPVFGHGLNSYAEESLANGFTKWSYEVVYVAWLAQTGLIGVFLLYKAVVKIYKGLLRKGRKYDSNVYYALIIGFFSFIICGASNPLVYLVWPWSIVLAFCHNNSVNVRLRKL